MTVPVDRRGGIASREPAPSPALTRPEPDGALDSLVGGLLGALGAEVWASRTVARFQPVGPLGAALVDLCHGYVAHRGATVPVELGTRHRGVTGAGWVLAIPFARVEIPRLVGDTLELAPALGVPRNAWGACVSYAELAACLLAGWSTEEALAVTPGLPPPDAAVPRWCGDGVIDSLNAGVWAMTQLEGVGEVVAALAGSTTAPVVATAAGLVGMRDGAAATPFGWLGPGAKAECQALAPALLRLHAPLEITP